MFGQTLTDTPYVQAGEWAEILERLYSATGPLDFDGRYYQLKQAVFCRPRCNRRARSP